VQDAWDWHDAKTWLERDPRIDRALEAQRLREQATAMEASRRTQIWTSSWKGTTSTWAPICCDSFFREIVDRHRGIKQEVLMFVCAGAMWTLWKARNDVVFNKKTVATPAVLVYKTFSLVKTWIPLLKPKLKPLAEEMIQIATSSANNL
jgi:hypothetical protein